MKLAPLFALATTFSLALPAQAGRPEYIPPYHITKTAVDKSLSKTEAVFAFTFSAERSYADHGTQAPDVPATGAIRFSYNSTEDTLTPNAKGEYDLKLKPGKYLFQFFYTSHFQEITTDSIEIKPAHRTSIKVGFRIAGVQVKCAKPVIYLYPTTPTEVQVLLDTKKNLDFTYPLYDKGWKVKAYPDGTLEQGNKTFGYLFWEGETNLNEKETDWSEGFVVNAQELTGFFEEKLSHLGLNGKEMQDFITYWTPRLQSQPRHYIHFLINEEFNRYATLNITPQPDQVLRVFMVACPLQANQELPVKAQTLPGFTRKGFTVIEWGGTVTNEIEKNIKSH